MQGKLAPRRRNRKISPHLAHLTREQDEIIGLLAREGVLDVGCWKIYSEKRELVIDEVGTLELSKVTFATSPFPNMYLQYRYRHVAAFSLWKMMMP